jgi:6-phosphofructokinase 1
MVMRDSRKLAVLTSGGDAAGMNAAVRSVVRAGLAAGVEVFGVEEGLQGLVDGGERIRPMSSSDVSGILQQGGTALGTARSDDFRTRDGRRRAAANLASLGVDGLVVIGGDGSLTGADVFRREWPELLDELVEADELAAAVAERRRHLGLVGLVGSIDNDMFGTDMTIGTDTALHRITEAVDAIQSTASSHQRTFVIEVMGRRCGYLALMSSISTGANFVLLPENPPHRGWEEAMCDILSSGRTIGRRANVVIVAEGARDWTGNEISAQYVREVLEHRLGEDARVTILGHVQRGGSPSAFDRFLGTVLGHAAVDRVLNDPPDAEPQLIGIRGHQVVASPLMECVRATRSVADVIADGEVERAMELRGGSFSSSYSLLRTLVRSRERSAPDGTRRLTIGVMHAGGPAPGMNAAVRVAVRVALARGHDVVGIRRGFRGLLEDQVDELDWMSVSGWVAEPGAELGTSRRLPRDDEFDEVAWTVDRHGIDGLLMVGGWSGYVGAHTLVEQAARRGRTDLPVICVPATINNDVPASELSIGADTALNSITGDVDKIKESAVASQRCFVVEVMGRDCGYLALMSGLTTGAERIYIPEEGMTIAGLQTDLMALRRGFTLGKRRGLVIRSEHADPLYTTEFVSALFQHESSGEFDVRGAILGHVQQGGSPSPFDRIQATRLASAATNRLLDGIERGEATSEMAGQQRGEVIFTPLAEFPDLVQSDVQRQRGEPWWMKLRPLADDMAAAHPDLAS